MYFIYMLRCSDNSLYTGITNDFQKRYEEHTARAKSAAKYTKSRQVIGVEAVWCCETKGDALRLECRIKTFDKAKKEKLVQNPEDVNNFGFDAKYDIYQKPEE